MFRLPKCSFKYSLEEMENIFNKYYTLIKKEEIVS